MSMALDMARRRATGFGVGPPDWEDYVLGYPDDDVIVTTTNEPRGSSGPGVWEAQLPTLIGGGLITLRDIFAPVGATQAAYGSTAAAYRSTAELEALRAAALARVPAGYGYNSSGQLVKQSLGSITDFVSSNPLLVGGFGVAVLLLFLKPPGRR